MAERADIGDHPPFGVRALTAVEGEDGAVSGALHGSLLSCAELLLQRRELVVDLGLALGQSPTPRFLGRPRRCGPPLRLLGGQLLCPNALGLGPDPGFASLR